jgi:hypothetical protein
MIRKSSPELHDGLYTHAVYVSRDLYAKKSSALTWLLPLGAAILLAASGELAWSLLGRLG